MLSRLQDLKLGILLVLGHLEDSLALLLVHYFPRGLGALEAAGYLRICEELFLLAFVCFETVVYVLQLV